jgi:transcriptional regulator with XRE-family HTH domain
MSFTDKIEALISKKKINKTIFLKDLGYSKNAFSEWKSGFTKSYMSKIDEIADYFDVSIDYLLGRTDSPRLPDGGDPQYLVNENMFTKESLEIALKFIEAPDHIKNIVRTALEVPNDVDAQELPGA